MTNYLDSISSKSSDSSLHGTGTTSYLDSMASIYSSTTVEPNSDPEPSKISSLSSDYLEQMNEDRHESEPIGSSVAASFSPKDNGKVPDIIPPISETTIEYPTMITKSSATTSSNYLEQMSQGGATALTGRGGFGGHLDSLKSSSSSLSGTGIQSYLDIIADPTVVQDSSVSTTETSEQTNSEPNLGTYLDTMSKDSNNELGSDIKVAKHLDSISSQTPDSVLGGTGTMSYLDSVASSKFDLSSTTLPVSSSTSAVEYVNSTVGSSSKVATSTFSSSSTLSMVNNTGETVSSYKRPALDTEPAPVITKVESPKRPPGAGTKSSMTSPQSETTKIPDNVGSPFLFSEPVVEQKSPSSGTASASTKVDLSKNTKKPASSSGTTDVSNQDQRKETPAPQSMQSQSKTNVDMIGDRSASKKFATESVSSKADYYLDQIKKLSSPPSAESQSTDDDSIGDMYKDSETVAKYKAARETGTFTSRAFGIPKDRVPPVQDMNRISSSEPAGKKYEGTLPKERLPSSTERLAAELYPNTDRLPSSTERLVADMTDVELLTDEEKRLILVFGSLILPLGVLLSSVGVLFESLYRPLSTYL